MIDLEHHQRALVAAGSAYLNALRNAAMASKLPILTRLADDFERQHLKWVLKRLETAANASPPEPPREGVAFGSPSVVA